MKLRDLIKLHEGTGPVKNGRMMPYRDSEGLLTIGYGRCIERVGISMIESDQLLDHDIARATSDCVRSFPWFMELDEVRQAVIVSMVFNLGLDGFKKFRRTISHIERSEWGEAAEEMLDSRWARQVGRRATELSDMMRTGQWPQ